MESLKNMELWNIFGLVACIKKLVLVDPEPKLRQDKKNRKNLGVCVELKSFVRPCKINAGELWNENNNWKQNRNILL